MNGYDFTASLFASVTTLAWPIAVFASFWLFREELKKVLPNLTAKWGDKSISFARGFESGQVLTVKEFQEAKNDAAPEKAKEIKAFEDLQTLADDELQAFTRRIADEMRALGHRYRQERDSLSQARWATDSHQDWRMFVEEFSKQFSHQAHEWRSTIYPTAIAIRDELIRRGAQEPNSPYGAPVALEPGVLAGVEPLQEAALWLERLARSLPMLRQGLGAGNSTQ